MTTKFRLLLIVLVSLLAICSQVVFGETKNGENTFTNLKKPDSNFASQK